MVSSPDDCRQLVAGNYDVIISESASPFRQALTNYLEHFQHHEQRLNQPECAYLSEFHLLKELSKVLKEDKANLEVGELDCNQKKNRYKDIIPFGHTRVVLQSQQQVNAGYTNKTEDDCYINANYIRGPSGSPRAYIACQGPLSCTLDDFWRMIWECNVSVIIMACNEFESGKPKCELYWPDQIDASQIYGNIQVTLSRVRQLNSDFLIRKFSVKLLAPKAQPADYNLADYDNNSKNGNQNSPPRATKRDDDNNNNYNYLKSERSLNQYKLNAPLPPLPEQAIPGNKLQQLRQNPSPTSSNKSCCSDSNNFPNSNNHQYATNTSIMLSGTSSDSIDTTSDTNTTASSSASAAAAVKGDSNNSRDSNKVSKKDQAATKSSAGGNAKRRQRKVSLDGRAVLAERTVCQFHYTTWPDHGVPDSVNPILELVRLVREVQPSEDRPILVHCSAGCGRTGTICCIDYVWGLLRMGKLDESFNLSRIISDMRQQRMAMVQTLEQYILCHRVVAALFIQHLQQIDSEQDLGPVFI